MPDPFVLVPPGTLDGCGPGERITLPDGVVHHLARVLRLRDGAAVVAGDGAGTVVDARVVGRRLEVGSAATHVERPRPTVTVWQALGKGRKHDEVVRVLTELGVDRIVATTSDRTVVDLSSKADRARDRWRSVAAAACEQARRPWLPALDGPADVGDLATSLDGRPCLVAHVGEVVDPLAAVESVGPTDEVVLAVGPEGGWTDGEVAALVDAGATPVGLGPTVLRTEHAATVLASIALAATGRLRPAGDVGD